MPFSTIEKLVQELAWRDYWQQIWIHRGDEIDQDLKSKQSRQTNSKIPLSILQAKTGIISIDKAIEAFYTTGYLHNHLRMYIAGLCCTLGRSHWHTPAQWMYYHLLDGDWASNALSWQWVAGTNSSKQYFANQENINKYTHSQQKNSFLDFSYEELYEREIPDELAQLSELNLSTQLPETPNFTIVKKLPTLIYTHYNLDPKWYEQLKANRILILEPSHYKKYPISPKVLQFVLDLSEMIPGLHVYVGDFSALQLKFPNTEFIFKEHPAFNHFYGKREDRDWMFEVEGYYPSFFKYWKLCLKEFNLKNNNASL